METTTITTVTAMTATTEIISNDAATTVMTTEELTTVTLAGEKMCISYSLVVDGVDLIFILQRGQTQYQNLRYQILVSFLTYI